MATSPAAEPMPPTTAGTPSWPSRAFVYDAPWRELAGALGRLDRLGVDVLLARGVFPVADAFGTFVADARERGIRVVVDWSPPPDALDDERAPAADAIEARVGEWKVDGLFVDAPLAAPAAFWRGLRARLAKHQPELALFAARSAGAASAAFDATGSSAWAHAWDDVHRGRARAGDLRRLLDRERAVRSAGARLRSASGDWHRDGVPDVAFARLALGVLLLAPGVPVLRAGQELGPRPESGGGPAAGDPSLPPFLARLGSLRRTRPALHSGSTRFVATDRFPHAFAFARSSPEETLLVVANLTGRRLTVAVRGPAWRGRSGLDLNSDAPVQVGERHPIAMGPLGLAIIDLGPV